MILYMSNATSYAVYDELFRTGKIKSGYQMQKFNNNLIEGLGKIEQLTAVSALPYAGEKADRINKEINGVRYIGIKNSTGFLHKPANLFWLYMEAERIIKKNNIRYIVCDAIALSPCFVSKLLGKKFKIPVVGIVTDIPGMLSEEKDSIKRMQNFDGYILLTKAMNEIVNPYSRPYIIMEGLCSSEIPELYLQKRNKVIIYSGSLWRKDAGIEYFIKGFLKAQIPDYEFHIYGTGELVDWIKEISKRFYNIRYMGCVTNDEMVKIQSKSMLLVNPRPSDREFCKYSFPSKTIEYMASGTPVLMTRLPGVPEEYFNFVYTIDREDSNGVSNILKKILLQPEEEILKIGEKARNYVSLNKSQKRQCERIYRFLNQL